MLATTCASNNSGGSSNSGSNSGSSGGNTAPTRVALFSAAQEDGDFGFERCQTILEDSTFPIGTELKRRGYTKAVFFGSTPTYDFIDLATDPDALGRTGQTPTALEARGLSLFALNSTSAVTETTMFTVSSVLIPRTVGNLVNVGAATGAWQNGGAEIITAAIGTGTSGAFWSFTADSVYLATNSCSGAAARAVTELAYYGDAIAVDGDNGVQSVNESCSTAYHVFCLAH